MREMTSLVGNTGEPTENSSPAVPLSPTAVSEKGLTPTGPTAHRAGTQEKLAPF